MLRNSLNTEYQGNYNLSVSAVFGMFILGLI